MTQTLTAADAKTRFDELAERIVETGEPIVVMLDSGSFITMMPSAGFVSEPVGPTPRLPARERLERLHAMLREELGDQPLEPDPVEMLRRVRNEEFE